MSSPQSMTTTASVPPCLTCPDGKSVAFSDGKFLNRPPIGWILNFGEPFYQQVAEHINSELSSGQPVGHVDGSLEFPIEKDGVPYPEPEDIYGYERDATNRRLFRPIWPSCIERALGVFVRDKQLVVAGRCNHFQAEHYMKPVTLDKCHECPARKPTLAEFKMPDTAEGFITEAEAKAAPILKARLGDDIFDRTAENLRRWALGLPPLKPGEKPPVSEPPVSEPPVSEPTDRIENATEPHGSVASSTV